MEYLLSTKNLGILKSFAIVDTLYAFDFDGTLCPIVSNHSEAILPDSIAEKLKQLNELVPLAIITGRSLEDIQQKLPFRPKHLIGNHGMEDHQSTEERIRFSNLCKSWIEIIDQLYREELNRLGIEIENKNLSLSFHYRKVKDVRHAEDFIFKMCLLMPDSKIISGKAVVNLVPSAGPNKGEALTELMKNEKYRFCAYVGDDVTDEDVFRINRPELLTVKVGTEYSNAKYYVNDHKEVEALLGYLLNFMS